MIESDAAFVVLIAVFGLTDGYLVNMCLMFGPRSVDAGMKEVGAAIFIVFNATSATIGTALGNLVVKLL